MEPTPTWTGSTTSANAGDRSHRQRLLDLQLEAARRQRTGVQRIKPRKDPAAPIPLSYSQEGLWFLDQLGLVGAAYNVPLRILMSGRLDEKALERSFAELVRRHESLRTRFALEDGVPYQIVSPPGNPFQLHKIDLTSIRVKEEQDRLMHESMQRELRHRFDLAAGPLLRVVLLKRSASDHVLLITMHHIISDGWSVGVLVRDLSALYNAFVNSQAVPVPELDVQYADYAVWQRRWLTGEVLDRQLNYWREQLRGAPAELQLPTDYPRPIVESFEGATLRFYIPSRLVNALTQVGQRSGATLYMVMLAAYQLLLSRWSGQEDIVVGSPIAGRQNQQIEDLIGFFVNTLPLRTDLSGNPSFGELIERVKIVTLDAYSNQDLPFETLVMAIRPERNLRHQPVFQVVLSMQNYPEESLSLEGLHWSWGDVEYVTTHFDLTLYIYTASDGLSAIIEYSTALFTQETISRLQQQFLTLLESISTDPNRRIHELPLLSNAERQKITASPNDFLPHVHARLIPDLFAIHVARRPDAIAVSCEGKTLTYAELNKRGNQLARYLRSRGAAPDKLVGLCTTRSIEMIIGTLGIVKAGAAYLPLDPSYPTERLSYMLRDAGPSLLLTQETLRSRLPTLRVDEILLDGDWPEIGKQPSTDLDIKMLGLQSSNLAYVIYTSGSTGNPKGVMVEHANVAGLFASTEQWLCPTENDIWTLFHSFAFDFSVWELWGALLYGGRIVVVPDTFTRSPQEFYSLICHEGVTILNQTPSAFLQLMEAQAHASDGHHSLRIVIFGGEALETHKLRPWVRRNGADRPKLINMYGITETTVHVTYHRLTKEEIESSSRSIIGKPIEDLQVFLLDEYAEPVAFGVPGEIYVGGRGVARGYLNRPSLTSERFVSNRFRRATQSRLYKTGDLGRWRADGAVEYVGRNDDQVKIRGFRIEPREIAAQIMGHPHIKEAIVIARKDDSGEKKLVAYVVGDRHAAAQEHTSARLRQDMVTGWESVFRDTYHAQDGDSPPSFVGWNSSYTAEPIPIQEMTEWLTSTVDRIRSMQPKRMLEIGCGTGLLLQHLAPKCSSYVGTDLSGRAIERLKHWVEVHTNLEQVQLFQQSATEMERLPPGPYDVIVLNSVVQYFPDVDYLLNVLDRAIQLVSPSGHIFIGDVRHLGLLRMFHSSVQLSKATAMVRAAELRDRLGRALADERELVIDPRFFHALRNRFTQIATVDVQLRMGRAHNEMTRYRYDAILHFGQSGHTDQPCHTIIWSQSNAIVQEVERALQERRWHTVRILSVPNLRLGRELAAQQLIESSDPGVDAGSMRQRLNSSSQWGVDPQIFWELAEQSGYHAQVTWSKDGAPSNFDVLLSCASRIRAEDNAASDSTPLHAYANNPLDNSYRQHLIPGLREYLTGRLPRHMMPSAWVVVRDIPLTPNGKIDIRALPMPQNRPNELGDYVAARTDLERTLASVWEKLLSVDHVGVHDNFFELGGHSLLAVKLLFKINQILGSSLRVVDLYQCPTVADLATRISASNPLPDEFVNLDQEAILPDDIAMKSRSHTHPTGAILLTGATGFVGRFLLAQLLRDTDATIYCHVRAHSKRDAEVRIESMLSKWDLAYANPRERVVPVPGDLSRPCLGIEAHMYDALRQQIDAIYHCGASMNHLESYAMAKPANVDGVREVLRMAAYGKTKTVNYISTLGVFASFGRTDERIVNEESTIDQERHPASHGYLGSKWVGEKLVSTATKRGIPCNIFRLGLVWADACSGRYDELQREDRIMRSSLISGFGIENYRQPMAPTPVDCVARSIVLLAERHRDGQGVFHISSSRPLESGLFEVCNGLLERPFKLVSTYRWICEIKRLHYEGLSLPAVPLVEFAFSMDEDTFDQYQCRRGYNKTRFECARTQAELERGGINAPIVDEPLLRAYLARTYREVERQIRL